ncbi:MAG: hypothetical protein M3N43_04135 [Actinomycetota bacterium]|nr:hypothetical protein [Actinomycetota bacterium]
MRVSVQWFQSFLDRLGLVLYVEFEEHRLVAIGIAQVSRFEVSAEPIP